MNACVAPAPIVALVGLMDIERSAGGGVTVSNAALLIKPSCDAVMLAVPALTPVAMPPPTVATAVFELAQVALAVMSAVLKSS